MCVRDVCVLFVWAVCLYVFFQSSETEVSTRGNGKREIETEEESTDGMMVGSTRETGSTERLTGTESKPVRMDRCGTMASGKTIFRNYDCLGILRYNACEHSNNWTRLEDDNDERTTITTTTRERRGNDEPLQKRVLRCDALRCTDTIQ